MTPIRILVTGVGGGGVGEQILKCLELSSLDYYVVGCDMSTASTGFSKTDIHYVVPKASEGGYKEALLSICKKSHIDVIFPGSEPELKVISAQRKEFENLGICVPLNPREVIELCMDKNRTMNFIAEAGFPTLRYWKIKDRKDIEGIDVFPLVLKPSIGGGGSNNTFIAQNKDELGLFGSYLCTIYDEFIVQEYIGDTEHEYTVGVLFSEHGEYINSIAVRKNIMSGLSNKIRTKNRTGKKELGDMLAISSGVSQGDIGRFEEVTIPSRKIGEKIGATAAINIQCRIHNGEMIVFEINPRISGTSSMRALAGFNEPEMLIRERLLGEQIEEDFEYKEGTILRGLYEVFI